MVIDKKREQLINKIIKLCQEFDSEHIFPDGYWRPLAEKIVKRKGFIKWIC